MPESSKSQLYTDRYYIEKTRRLARLCPASETAFAVGAILITRNGNIYTGYSRELGQTDHAEEVVFAKAIKASDTIKRATLYSSLEPCSQRSSKPVSCSELTIKKRVARVVFGKREGTKFVADCRGAENMKAAGIEVVEGIL